MSEHVNGKPALDWSMRKSIALSVARGLLYLHEQCNPKIIHRDIKASNILLDEHLEAVIADFGLAKLVDLGVSHVITEARGTLGRIPPESLMTGHSSDKSDVFGFGLLLIELVTGRETLELHQNEYENGGILDWVNISCCVSLTTILLFFSPLIKKSSHLAHPPKKGLDITSTWACMLNVFENNINEHEQHGAEEINWD